MSVYSVGGRSSISYQDSHTIPKQLFKGTDRPELIKLFQKLPGNEGVLNLDSFDNLQPLPDSAQPLPGSPASQGYAVHRGSHPGYTQAVKARLDEVSLSFFAEHDSDIKAFNAGTADEATVNRLRQNAANTLQAQIDDIQFRSTNFMDTASR